MDIANLLKTGTTEEILEYLEKTRREYELMIDQTADLAASAMLANVRTGHQAFDDVSLNAMDDLIDYATNLIKIKVALEFVRPERYEGSKEIATEILLPLLED